MENTENLSPDLLGDEFHPLLRFTEATRGERFINYVIDNLLMRYALSYLTGMMVGSIGAAIAPEFMSRLVYGENRVNLLLFSYVIYIINYIFYYTLCEKLLKGQTLGKLITKTKAIRTDGEELTFKDAMLRSLCRIVPFEPFSGFGVPWHDTWTKTMVVKTK
jgi:uncharacterized RDD family membrane protein YckC